MSNRLFQGIVHQMRDSIDRVIGVIDETATVISCSDLTKIGETFEYLMLGANETADVSYGTTTPTSPLALPGNPSTPSLSRAPTMSRLNTATYSPSPSPASNSIMMKNMTAQTLLKT